MRVVYIECSVDELKANRGIMDAIVEACHGMLNGFYGTYSPDCNDETEQTTEDTEEGQEDE